MAAAPAAPLSSHGTVRDFLLFPIKKELESLYLQIRPELEREEAERAELWSKFMAELAEAMPQTSNVEGQEAEAQLLQRALAHLAATTEAGRPPERAAEMLQRLSSLVQAGLPMAQRGAFWRLFLNVGRKRRVGEYQRLVAEVAAIEVASAAAAVACAPTPLPACGQEPVKPCGQQAGVLTLVADCSGAEEAHYRCEIEAGVSLQTQLHRVEVFSIQPLECEDTPCATPVKQPTGEAVDGLQASGVPGAAEQPLQAAALDLTDIAPTATPSSTAATPGTCPDTLTGCVDSGKAGTAAAPPPVCPGSEGDSSGGSTASAWVADTAACWRQQEYLQQIDKDINRSFPGHPMMDEGGMAALRRILSAYARRNTAVGYCQGLNFIAATFLLMMPEEEAFWCLAALVEDLLGSSYFDERMVAAQVDARVFSHLLQGRFPRLCAHLAGLEVEPASVTLHWFLLAFLNSLPMDSAMRVWDLLFFEGSPVVLFRVALALVEIYEQALLQSRESSEAYMTLQSLAQVSFDASRLVHTAAIAFSHLKPAGLATLRQRYRADVLSNLRATFASEDDYCRYLDSQEVSPAGSGSSEGRGAGSPCSPLPFAQAFQRTSSALVQAEEEALRAAGSCGASGQHRPTSPGHRGHGSSPGGLPSSPLARVRQAVGGLAARLIPATLPPPLPSGPLNASGQEQLPLQSSRAGMSTQQWSSWPAGQQSRAASSPASRAALAAAPHMRRINVGGACRTAAGSPSPTADRHHLAGRGAVLERRAIRRQLTPFTELSSLLECEQQCRAAAAATPPQLPLQPASSSSPGVLSGELAASFQSMPSTPSELLLQPPPPPPSHRRALTAGDSSGSRASGAHRRRRRLTLDLLHWADLRLDLAQPGVAAALAIAANPSPRGPPCCDAGCHKHPHTTAWHGHAAGAAQALLGCAAGSPPTASCADALVSPMRTLCFEEADDEGKEPGVRRAATAPPAVLLACCTSGSTTVSAGDGCEQQAADTAGTCQASALSPASSTCASGCPRQADLPAATTLATPSAWSSTSSGAQQAPALSAVVAQLQEEVALAESRRHAAELAAQQAQQTAADLQRQLAKVLGQVADKEALLVQLAQQLEAATTAAGHMAAQALAAEKQEAELEQQRHQLTAADALIGRLMDALSAEACRGGTLGSWSSSTSSKATSPAASWGEGDPGRQYNDGFACTPQSKSHSVASS